MTNATVDAKTTAALDAAGPLPQGRQLTALDDDFRQDPFTVLGRLRNAQPVYWDAEFSRWFITGAEELQRVLRDKDIGSDPMKGQPGSYSARFVALTRESRLDIMLQSMLFQDDPQHRRLRALVSKPFGIKEIDKLRPRIRQIATDLLDEITTARFDLMSSFADPLPVRVIGDMLGVHADRGEQFKHWSEDLAVGLFSPMPSAEQVQRGAAAVRQLHDYFGALVAERRHSPGTDLVSALVAATDGDCAPLSDEEVIAQCILLLTAGNVTTTDFIGNAVRTLLLHPQQLAQLRANPGLMAAAMEEVLRYEPPVTMMMRVVSQDMTFNGCPFKKGQSLGLSQAAANRDPNTNSEPDRFDIHRHTIRHHSFGGNKHLCLGAHLARAEAQEAVAALLARFPKLALAEQAFEFRAWPAFRGTRELWLIHEA